MPNSERHDLDGCDDDIAALYLKTAETQIKQLAAAIDRESWEAVQHAAHKLSGSSAFLQLKAIATLLNGIEQSASQQDATEASRLLEMAKDEFAQIKSHYNSPAPKSKTPQLISSAPASKKKFKVFVVDDHPLIREGLVRLIALQEDLKLCGQASSAHQALKMIPALKPDIVVLDITLAGSDGMGLIKDMKLRYLKTPILVLSMHDESLYAERSLRAGAKGYIMKQETPKELLRAIHRVLDGEIYLSATMEAKMLHKIADSGTSDKKLPEGSLSDRELQTFQLIGQGRGTREIAAELNISPKTVESYRAHIKVKMNLRNAHELTQHAVHWVESNHLN